MLPNGFQPRPCLFCGSRSLMNRKVEDEKYQVQCLYCKAEGPATDNNDDAWMNWSGLGIKMAPAMFGTNQGLF